MSNILLYQPYYHFPGHFKTQFHAFRKGLKEIGFTCIGVVGLWHPDKIEKSDDIFSFHYKTQSDTFRIFANILGLSRVRHILMQESITSIHFLDIEIFHLFIFLFFNRSTVKHTRIIVTQHSINRLQNQTSFIFSSLYKWVIRRSYTYIEKNFDLKVLTNGRNITRWLINENFLEPATITTTWWASQFEVKEIDWSLKNPGSLLFYGIIRKDKNIEYLLKSVSEADQSLRLHIAGYPIDYSERQLHDLLNKYELSDAQVTLELGYLSEQRIAELLRFSSFIILPYSDKNLSNSGPLIDAIQFGCIPVASGYGERYEFINFFDAGYLFYFDRSPTLKDLLSEHLQNSESNTHYRETLSKIRKQFTWEWIIRDLVLNRVIYR